MKQNENNNAQAEQNKEQDEQLTKTRATILKAFKEYENVTSKYSMEEALYQEKVQKIKTVNGCKLILIIMHLRYLNTLKSSFDKMKVFAEHREDIVTLQHEVDEISETFEKLSVTEADIKEIEETYSDNAKEYKSLRKSLKIPAKTSTPKRWKKSRRPTFRLF